MRRVAQDGLSYNEVKRRLKDAGLPARLLPHSFRVTTITDLLVSLDRKPARNSRIMLSWQ